ncbi:MAG: proton-conducting transporter membrane subunit, partial [Bacteroidota bacterium]
AMFPLHIWLPDAMEGPTPVSALIHAATMVVAGVYLVARLFPIYAISAPQLLHIIGYIGIISSALAAIIACTQTDIKRVLAYSTISQIGYMLAALGVSQYGGAEGEGFSASMFHLFTHAFFKALLFLCAGSVIHYVHSNEVKDMGGLRKKMPVTHLCFLLACLAIAGIPPLSGFFSKEEILAAAFAHNQTIFYIAWLTAGLTSFYMFRLYFLTFWNKDYVSHHDAHEHHSEGSWNMKLPLIILMLGAVGAGFVPFHNLVTSDGRAYENEFHLNITLMAVGLSLFAIIIATVLYQKKNNLPDKIAGSISQFYNFAYHKFYFDEVYQFITQKFVFNIVGSFSAWFDRTIVNETVNTTAYLTEIFSDTLKPVQSGKVQGYALFFLFGILGLIFFLFFLNI